ncbi:hypothetical protein [Xenophilus sp.]|jgi:hypothetical protein|uniref:hypothetical protein n=1 Tax=Xenophilus sp. TaxID=1873499 RepID=UPI0037DDC5FA
MPRPSSRPHLLLAALPCLLAGCGTAGAPSHVLFGAYFPSWLLFALLWALLAAGVRVTMVLAGGGTHWPWPLALCTAASFLLALGLWLLTTGGLP